MSHTYEYLIVELQKNGVLSITLNRPDKLNALNSAVFAELALVLAQAQQDKKIKALLITGAGKAFCAGADINRLAEINAQQGYEFATEGQAIFNTLETLGKPSLAAINGFAFGGGCELAMATTLRIAADVAKLGQPEIKLGVIPGYGGTQRLTRLVGKGRALELCLTGRTISATEAQQWGLVNEVVTSDQLIPRANEILESIITLAPLAAQGIMNAIHYGADMTLADALHLEAVQFGLACASKDKKEGVAAFLEKRQPQFTGE